MAEPLEHRTIRQVELLLLGELVLRVDGEHVAITAPKQRALLALLALRAGEPVDADRLIDALWGERPPATAAKNLQVLVGRVRSLLEPERAAGADPTILCSTPGGYLLDPSSCRIDVVDFEAIAASARGMLVEGARGELEATEVSTALRLARELWRGRPLGELGYEPWAVADVARLEELHVSLLELEIEHQLAQGRHEQVVPWLEQLVIDHPTRERLRAQQMLALYRTGRQADALEAFADARRMLDEELGIEPGRELRELQRRILEQDVGLDQRPAAARVLPQPPVPRTSLVGRDRELDRIGELLAADEVRLVTLTGWGGVGKTRIAGEAARRAQAAFDETCWVELASVRSAEHVPALLQAAFGIGDVEGDRADALAQAIGQSRLLLVLDNFEHVVEAAPLVTHLLVGCPSLTVLATSRVPLGVYGEHDYALHPFVAGSGDAIELFVERARAVGYSAGAGGDLATTIAEICARVDGLPLAIELAAARARLLSPSEILDRLDRRLGLLTSGAADLPDRQRSLRGAIEWSYDLLDDDERAALRSLGAFIGGCSIDAALVVLDVGDEFRALDLFESLATKHLVARHEDSGVVRLSMLESIAEFAREQLDTDPDAEAIRARHAAWYHRIAMDADTPRHTPDVVQDRERMQRDIPNVRAAADWALEHDPGIGVDIASVLAHALVAGGSADVASDLMGRALTRGQECTASSRARLHAVAGEIAQRQGRPGDAARHRRTALATYESAADSFGVATTLLGLGEGELVLANFDGAREYFDRAANHAIDDRWLMGAIENQRGCLAANMADMDRAFEHFTLARHHFDVVGDRYWSAYMTMNLGCHAVDTGCPDRGIEYLEKSLNGFEQCGYRQMSAHVQCNMVLALMELDRFPDACELASAAVRSARSSGDVLVLSYGLTMCAVAQLGAGRAKEALATAYDALDVSIRSDRLRFAHYAAYVVAASDLEPVVRTVRAWLSIDNELLLDSCGMDRRVRESLATGLTTCRELLGHDAFEEIAEDWTSRPFDERLRSLSTWRPDEHASGLSHELRATT